MTEKGELLSWDFRESVKGLIRLADDEFVDEIEELEKAIIMLTAHMTFVRGRLLKDLRRLRRGNNK